MSSMHKKAVIVISSHVARGSVGNRATVFALETLGFPVWAIPTVTLPWHPGHGPSTRITAAPKEFENFLNDITNAPWIEEIGAVLTGYMANAEQVISVSKLISKLKTENPKLTYLCDPVIGDKTGLYVKEEIAMAIRDKLIPISDIATPNCFELAWLTKSDAPQTIEETIELAKKLETREVLTTSSPSPKIAEETGNLYYSATNKLLASHKQFKNPPNGPGDLTAAIYLGHLLAGLAPETNLAQTTASVFEILQNATELGSSELNLESDAQSIVNPEAKIAITSLKS